MDQNSAIYGENGCVLITPFILTGSFSHHLREFAHAKVKIFCLIFPIYNTVLINFTTLQTGSLKRPVPLGSRAPCFLSYIGVITLYIGWWSICIPFVYSPVQFHLSFFCWLCTNYLHRASLFSFVGYWFFHVLFWVLNMIWYNVYTYVSLGIISSFSLFHYL